MDIFVIGSGAREHAIVWKCAQSKLVGQVYCAPGNAGIGLIAQRVDIDATDIEGILAFAKEHHITFTIVGPEATLFKGLVDAFEKEGLAEQEMYILGATRDAAQIEWSKFYAKTMMRNWGIPTADYRVFNYPKFAKEYVAEYAKPCVIKADGLAQGKGVVVAKTTEEALAGIDEIMATKAGKVILVEEYLSGWECSFTVLTDGKSIVPFPVAKDYKRAYDRDRGPNTGGMGGYCPVPDISQKLYNEILDRIMKPAIEGLARRGRPYKGFLYAGLMITRNGPYVIEFNARLGDPEAQVLLPSLESDFVELCLAAAKGELDRNNDAHWSSDAFVNVVLASPGYPKDPMTGDRIYGLEKKFVFHAGTELDEQGEFVTSGGRVLSVIGRGNDKNIRRALKKARLNAYGAAGWISFGEIDPRNGKQIYRRDIAKD